MWESPACSVRGPPSLLSLHLVRCARGLHTAQLENVTSLERFPRALPGSPPPRQAPSAYFSSLAPQPPAAWGARRAGAWPREPPPPRRGLGCPAPRRPRVRSGQVGAAPRGRPSRFPPAARPALTCAAPDAVAGAIPSCRGCSGTHQAARAARGAGFPWPAPQRAAPRRRTARPAGGGGPSPPPPGPHLAPCGAPAGVRPPRRPAAHRPGPAAARGPCSSLAQPPGASQRLRPAEWPALLAAGAAEGRREAGSARISINLGPRRSPPPAPSLPPDPRPDSELTPEGPPASKRLRREQPWGGRGARRPSRPGMPPNTPIHGRSPRARVRSRARPLGPAWAWGSPGAAHPPDTLLLKASVHLGTAVHDFGAEMTAFWVAPATPPQPPPWNRPQIVPVG